MLDPLWPSGRLGTSMLKVRIRGFDTSQNNDEKVREPGSIHFLYGGWPGPLGPGPVCFLSVRVFDLMFVKNKNVNRQCVLIYFDCF